MAAPQQSRGRIYRDTSNIPNPYTDRYTHNLNKAPGARLADALGVGITKFANERQETRDKNEKSWETADAAADVAHAQLGMDAMDRESAGGGGRDVRSGEFEPDAHAAKLGQIAGSEAAGSLRDKYAEDEVHKFKDPQKVQAWIKTQTTAGIEAAKAEGYNHYVSYVQELGNAVEKMSKEYAGHLEKNMQSAEQARTKRKITEANAVDEVTTRRSDLMGVFEDLFVNESSRQWNALAGRASQKDMVLSEMTMDELISWQYADPGESAAGIIQIIPSTLKGMRDKYGYSGNTKVTKELQMELGLFLMHEKGLGEWLAGELPDSQFAERLSGTWAAWKGQDGKGKYDGVGSNKASVSHEGVIRKLSALKHHMKNNTDLSNYFVKLYKEDKAAKAGDTAGLIVGGSGDTAFIPNTQEIITGNGGAAMATPEKRELFYEQLLTQIAEGKDVPVESIIEGMSKTDHGGFTTEQKEGLMAAQETHNQRAEIAQGEEMTANAQTAHTAITSGSPEDMDELRQADPEAYKVIVERTARQDPAHQQAYDEEWSSNVDVTSENLPSVALEAYKSGEISKAAYVDTIKEWEDNTKVVPVRRASGYSDTIRDAKQGIHKSLHKSVDQQIDAYILGYMEDNDGKPPRILEFNEAVDQITARKIQAQQANNAAIMERYTN